jgi:hypothetical protein
MGTLNNRFQYVWYGTCTEHDTQGCKPYKFSQNLIQLKSVVESISTFGPGPLNSAEFFKPDTEDGTLESLECGVMYSIVLKPGKVFTLPGLTPAGTETIKSGENSFPSAISFTCENVYEPTPTPTPFACIPLTAEYEKVKITSGGHQELINGVFQGFVGFQSSDIIGMDMTWFVSALATTVKVKVPSLGTESEIILSGLGPKSQGGELYLLRGPACFRGPFQLVGGNWEVTMQLINGELPTPTPVLDPTPTPAPVCLCAPGNYTNITSSGSDFISDGHQFVTFPVGSVISYDESTLVSALAATVSFTLPNGVASGIIVFANKKPGNNTTFYLKVGNTCYSATTSSSQSSGSFVLSVYKTLSSDCGDDNPLPTPTPTPAQPEPTPTPVSSGDCCPDSHASFTTVGGVGLQFHEYTPPGANATTLLTWQGFDNGGKLCVDLTLTSGWSENSFESAKGVFLNSASGMQIGMLRKLLKNGNDRGDIYYTDINNKCWTGEYGDADIVVLT